MIFSNLYKVASSQIRPQVSMAFSLGGSFVNSAWYSSFSSATFLLRTPSPSAPREVPTPLVFVSAGRWDPSSQSGMGTMAALYAERGYTCMEIDLPHLGEKTTSEALMHHFEFELTSHIRLCAIPFAPVIIARSSGALIAQTYISSHPASAMLLISPPASNSSVSSLLPTPLREFDFEPRFPCGIICTKDEAVVLKANNRLWQDPDVDKMIVGDIKDIDGQEGFVKIEQWLDEIGI